jgi:hypothetical protein
VSRKRHKESYQLLIRVGRKPISNGSAGGPGRAGPAFADFFVEPFPLDFWNLEKSFARTRPTPLLVYPSCIKSFVKGVRNRNPRPLSQRHRCTYFTFIALLLIPSPTLSDSIATDAKRCSLTRRILTLDDGFFIVAVIQAIRRPHSRSESPEILGRIVFFITAVGRSPPAVAKP